MKATVEHTPKALDDFAVMLWSGAPVDYIWEDVEPLLRQGEEYLAPHYSLADVRTLLHGGRLVLWTAADEGGIVLVMLVELTRLPGCEVARILYIGGSGVKKVLPMIDFLHLWARRQGVDRIEVTGRPGWLRLLEPEGYLFESVTLVRDLSDVKEH